MQRLNVKDIQPGMRLAEDVIGAKGRLLLVKGSLLAEKHLRILNVWGVSEVRIQETAATQEPASREDGLDADSIEACRAYVREIFGANQARDDFGRELFRLGLKWFAAKYQEGFRPPQLCPCYTPEPDAPAAKAEPASLQSVLAKGQRMVACPEIYTRILNALDNPNCSAAYLAEIIGKDIALSAKLLRLVNSPVYGLSKKVDSLIWGITVVGFKELGQLVLGISVVNLFLGVRSDVLNVREFLTHAISTGILAKLLAAHCEDLPEERFFVAGLLHDIGRMSMLIYDPLLLSAAICASRARREPLVGFEKTTFGFGHDEVGGELLRQWKLPPELEDPIRNHHTPELADDPRGASLLCLADVLATLMQSGFSGNYHLPLVSQRVFELSGLPLGACESVMTQAKRQIDETLRAFLG